MAGLVDKKKAIRINGKIIRPQDVNFVLVGFEDDPSSFRKIPRHRCTVKGLKISHGVDVDHLRNELGEVVWPKDFEETLVPPPFKYFIYVKTPHTVEEDWEDNSDFFGQTVVGCFNVPKELDANQLYHWLQRGLDDEDVILDAVKQNLAQAERKLQKTIRRIEAIPYMAVRGKNDIERGEKRRAIAQSLGAEKKEREEYVHAMQRRLKGEKIRRATEVFTLAMAKPDAAAALETAEMKGAMDDLLRRKNKKKAEKAAREAADRRAHEGHTWYVQLPDRLEFLGRVMVHKTDWMEYRLSIQPKTGHIWVGKGDMPKEYWRGEVNMRGVSVARRPHGRGTMRFPDRSRGIYVGDWVEGHPQGVGSRITEAGRYEGTIMDGLRVGRGAMAYATGDKYVGDFNHDASRPVGSLINGDEYMDGGPSKFGVFEFVDGATYEGLWNHGRPNGRGTYTSKDGDMYSGFWKDGVMHGPCAVSKADGTMMDGEFRNGSLERECHVRQPGLFSYVGNVTQGMPDGRGLMVLANADRYTGYFKNGLRQGRGTLLYKNVKMHYNKLTLQTRYSAYRRYDGLWRAGNIRARNMHTDIERDELYFTTNNKSKRFPELYVLNKNQTDIWYRKKKLAKDKAEEDLEARTKREKSLFTSFNRDRQLARKNLKWLGTHKAEQVKQEIVRFKATLQSAFAQELDDNSTATSGGRTAGGRSRNRARSVASSR